MNTTLLTVPLTLLRSTVPHRPSSFVVYQAATGGKHGVSLAAPRQYYSLISY